MPSFFFNDTATTEISTLSPHDALPISLLVTAFAGVAIIDFTDSACQIVGTLLHRSEEHTSELQTQFHLVCRLFFLMIRRPPRSPLFPHTTLFRSPSSSPHSPALLLSTSPIRLVRLLARSSTDPKSTRLNSRHSSISYAVFFF